MDYEVKLDGFEGPLDLLLHLIKKHELDIMNIPIALITRQYVDSIELMKTMNLDIAGEFLLMAATLMHIKSKMLLPPEEVEEGEEEELDPREELVRRLLEYKKYKDAGSQLGERDILDRDLFSKGFSEEYDDENDDLVYPEVGLFDLLDALQEVLKSVTPSIAHAVNMERISIKEKTEIILNRLKEERNMTFQSLFDNDSTRGEIVASFLALLELIKMRTVNVFQGENFGVIRITSKDLLH
ncbi:MAG: segregation/condensation protein A [Proteobacteria bacterium]|nr:segregation/condensation protein A [Pseudomonadota bacterium]